MDQIGPLREKLREIDDSIITLLEARLDIVGEVWKIKRENGIPLRDRKKERELIEDMKKKSKLNPQMIEILFEQIFDENSRIHDF